jgi:hypothetical protein
MTQFKRLIAFLLCLLMIFPTQELTILAETMSMDHVQIEEMISEEPAEDGTDRVEEAQQSDSTEDGEERIKETLPLEPMEEESDRVKETLPLEPMEEETERVTETLPLDPMQEETERVTETLPLEPMEEETERIKETLPLEPITGGNGGADLINKTLSLEPLEDEGYAIYWNPGGQLPVDLATPSNATANATSTASDATSAKASAGRDTASGLSPAKPVKTLAKAIERAKKLIEKEGLDPSDVTIYAMNPMEVADGELYALNAGNIRIASWPGRPYESDALFYVNGGQLTLMNVLLEAEEPAHGSNETELIYVQGGVLQMGQNVNINGCVIMDYSNEQEAIEWKNEWIDDFATPSSAVKVLETGDRVAEQNNQIVAETDDKSDPFNIEETVGTAGKENKRIEEVLPLKSLSSATKKTRWTGKTFFDIDNYKIDRDEENIKLVKDSKSASTWRSPIVELIDGFDGNSGEYLLKVKDDGMTKSRELVKTLYADEASAEDFLSYFTLAESDNWNLQVEVAAADQIEDTESEDKIQPLSFPLEEETMTRKTLIAIRPFVETKVIYWNPGAGMTFDGVSYPAGNDSLYDGSLPSAPFKTWEAAAEEAKKVGGIVVAMRSVNLGDGNASEYLEQLPSGAFYMASVETALITPVGTWSVNPSPVIIVPKNTTLIVEDLFLGGMYNNNGEETGTDAQSILINEGDLVIGKNVRTEGKGYIQVDVSPDLKNHPIQVCSVEAEHDGELKVFFGGINNNIAYRYVDVVIPGGDLAESIDDIADDEERAVEANSVGGKLFDRVKLHDYNKSVENGGISSINWILRQDTADDDSIVNAQNLELYADYYFDSIYIDGVKGNNDNYGSTCEYPVKTWDIARDIWQKEMSKSLDARHKAAERGMTSDEIEADYPIPEVIYICNTVTVNSLENWDLHTYHDDVRNADIVTEVVSHIDNIATEGEGSAKVPRHEAPMTLIEVTDNGVLNITDVRIRNMVDDSNSVTIAVEKNGTLNLLGNTTLTGTRLKSTNYEKKDLTLGSHVRVGKDSGSGRFVMEQSWNGSIEYREQGVVASGTNTIVEMKSGSIQKNNSYREDLYMEGSTNHKNGGGVALSGGAQFTMNGGAITGNQTYKCGAGVYLEGNGTSFTMKKGKITNNSMPAYRASYTDSTMLHSQGVGIFADTATILKIGDEEDEEDEVTLISGNKASVAYGAGIFANGNLTINNAEISDNVTGGNSSAKGISYGAGIYVGLEGTLTMENSLVKGNHGSVSEYGGVYGAGIYIAGAKSSNTHTISGSVITENKSGVDTTSSNSNGGGIFLSDGNTLMIKDTKVCRNRATSGGGIYAAGTSMPGISLTLINTEIIQNEGRSYNLSSGSNGGMYFGGYGTLTLEDGTKINDNVAYAYAGGIRINGSSSTGTHVYMMATAPGEIEISGNKIITNGDATSYGGGVAHTGGSWHAENVLISNNDGGAQGGGIYSNGTSSYAYLRNVTISDNGATDGAALAIGSGRYYMQACTIENNEAANRGGGIYSSGSGYIYLSETENRKFEIKDNRANYGGGIAIVNANAFLMDITGQIKNRAAIEGSNFYLNGYAGIDILSGHFEQPDEPVDGVHNIYINDTNSVSTTAYNKYFDFSQVVVDKKAVGKPDAILLDSGNSYLIVLKVPPNDERGTLPIDLNSEAFQSGSLVLKAAGNAPRPVVKPNESLSGSSSADEPYNTSDASGHLDYFRDGKLPRRNVLSGVPDASNSSRTNVILVGQGVYLDGANGDNSKDGLTPLTAVKDFETAKSILEGQIEAIAESEENQGLSEDEGEGFAPFIYICGQVSIGGDVSWKLDYKDELYKTVNKRYAAEEVRNGDPVHDAQVRRFASFVNKPMITVGYGGKFTTKRLIINGMADSVVLADQTSKSPVIEGSEGSKVTMTGDSMITNNYYSALDISGELILNSDDGTENKQLYNNQALSMVRLFGSAKMSMLDDAKIITDNTVEKVASFTSRGIDIIGSGVSVSMDGNSAIIQEPGSTLMGNYLIYSGSANTNIKMKGNAKLEVGNSVEKVLYISGDNSLIEMSGTSSITTVENGYLGQGIVVGNNTSLIMSEAANVSFGVSPIGTSTYGIYLQPKSPATASVKMRDNAAIVLKDNVSSIISNGYNYGIMVASGNSPKVELLNNARIAGSPTVINTIGICVRNATAAIPSATISLNMEMDEDGSKDDSASISDMTNGIELGYGGKYSISMGKKAELTGNQYGIYVTSWDGSGATADILLKGHSKICKSRNGIYLYTSTSSPINITLEDYAAIEQNEKGISDFLGSAYSLNGPWRLNVKMSGESRISGNSSTGIQLASLSKGWSELGNYQTITLNDNARIGGSEDSKYYNSSDGESGNQGAGIYANGPVQVTMNGNASISYNGTNPNNNNSDTGWSNPPKFSGIYLTRPISSSVPRAGTANVTMNGSASIHDNKGGGVYVKDDASFVDPNKVIIELNGTDDDGPSIYGNTDGIYIGPETTLKLKGKSQVKISDDPYKTSSYTPRVIDNFGNIELDGRSTVEGLIFMNNKTNSNPNPITMTHAAEGAAPKYDLYLATNYVGNIVVQPDMNGIMDLTGTNSQLKYFNKVNTSDALINSMPITERKPNLVLEGDNNVYLSGSGNDGYSGQSPSTAVRTFRRAKELLEGGENGGYYTTGANIIICRSEVIVEAGDEDWSFDSGGFVTNLQSENTWKPLVIRGEGYNDGLISITVGYSGTASTVTFKNITIDGGSEKDIFVTGQNAQLLNIVGSGKTAILGEGAVLQNNKSASNQYLSNNTALGVVVNEASLVIDGGIIRNITREINNGSNCQLASAVAVKGYSSNNPGKLILKSGQIMENRMEASYISAASMIGTIYIGAYGNLEMSGGLIENNRVILNNFNEVKASGTIVNYDGNVTISGGTIRGNKGGYGSAIYHWGISNSSKLIFSGGQISGNTTTAPEQQSIDQYSPIYIRQNGFELFGNSVDIRDSIYLHNSSGIIKVSDHMVQTGHSYRVYIGDFKKGNVVVTPDGSRVANVSSYLPYFDARSNPLVLDQGRTSAPAGSVAGVTEEQCLILMKAVYLDSEHGSDANTGFTPLQAVATFTRAKEVGMDAGVTPNYGTSAHYMIYVCGKAVNTSSESSTWELPKTAYMCRYTGFPVYETNGTETQKFRAYYGYLIEPKNNLTFKDISIQGRRSIDSVECKGDSLVHILGGSKVTVEDKAVFSNNNNNGNYPDSDGYTSILSSKGGAFQVDTGGSLTINGGEIQGNNATYGSAIYLHASASDSSSFGQLHLTSSPIISGKVYLDGTANITGAYIQSDATYIPSSALQISVCNDHNGRSLIKYTDGTTPGDTELNHYSFDDAINALYDIANRSGEPSMLELSLRKVIYLDGKEGNDAQDGTTPRTAFRTLKRTFEAIGDQADTRGVLVYVVGTVDITAEEDIHLMNIKVIDSATTSHYEGYYNDLDGEVPIRGQVYFKRYSQPKGYDAENSAVYGGYDKKTLLDSLFCIEDGGVLTLSGIYLDGHSINTDSSLPTLAALKVPAQSPLITIKEGGELNCNRAEGVSNGVPTATRFTNNINEKNKDSSEYVVGQRNGFPIMEGSSAGIEILNDGTCILEYTEFINLELGEKVAFGGTDVYSNGKLHVSLYTNFGGSVFLEGFGTKDNEDQNQKTSRYIDIDRDGTPIQHSFHLMMRDPYVGRNVVYYPEGTVATDTKAGYYLLEDVVKDFFYLSNSSEYPHILKLQVPTAVYINGATGNDDPEDRFAGSTPKNPVKTLEKAFKSLKSRGENTIYVVGTIQVESNIQVTGQSYSGTNGTVILGSTNKVNIVRYIKPDFAIESPNAEAAKGYQVDDFTGVLLNINGGATAQFSDNVIFDGHRKRKDSINLPEEVVVRSDGNKAEAPLITVKEGGTLRLLSNVTLRDNNNNSPDNATTDHQGGAISNSGTTTVGDTLFENNKAEKGSVVYQDGNFTIVSAPIRLIDNDTNTFYLTSDHMIHTAVAIPDDQFFGVDMDSEYAVKGRDVVRFTSKSAYNPNADAEYDHFHLGTTVPEYLFLVEAADDEDVLELQDWDILKVSVPEDIYLVARKGSNSNTNQIVGVKSDSTGSDPFTAPEYTITNESIYGVKVSINGFENKTTDAGITTDLMELTDNRTPVGEDLYLAVKGSDNASGKGFIFNETPLKPYEGATPSAPLELGTLDPDESGKFTFIGFVGNGFVEKYSDPDFPLTGNGSDAHKYMDGDSGLNEMKAKAKYLLKYKVEINPSRRNWIP